MSASRPQAVAEPPITARTVIASVLLPLDPPELPGQSLVRCAALFDIAEGTCRVALSRMVAAGELETVEGRYRLTGRLAARQVRQTESRHPRLVPWDGRWHMAVVTGAGRTAGERAVLRDELRRLRMAEWREGVWLRPANLPWWPAAVAGIDAGVGGHCSWFTGVLDRSDAGEPAALAARLWDPAAWAAEAARLAGRLGETQPALERGDPRALAAGFRVAAALVRHLVADPLLPPDLLPPGWPGDEVRARYDAYEAAYRHTLMAWVRRQQPPADA